MTWDRLRIHILADNDPASKEFASQWGLSMALELPGGQTWLWDTGQDGVFLDNAARMGLDLADCAGLALSHGHWDHTGGLPALARTGFSGPVAAHPDIFKNRWSLHPGTQTRAIGIPEESARVLKGMDMIPVDKTRELAPGLWMLTDIPRLPGNPQYVDDFFLDPGGQNPDAVPDDACLVVDTGRGPVLVAGCCHSGLGNTLAEVKSRLGMDRIHALLGGLHLHKSSRDEVAKTAEIVDEFYIERVHAGHCTGADARAILAELLPGRCLALGAGSSLEF